MVDRRLALGALTLGVLLIGIDGTALAVSTPFIATDLRASATDVLWIGDIYSFILAGLLVAMGSIGDRVGHKKLLLCAASAFGIFSVAAAYAQSAGQLIGARALLGVAGAALAPSTLALIRGLFPRGRERSVAVGIWASGFSAGSALGPVVGGLLLEHFWWGSVFLVNLPVVALLVVAGAVLVPELPSRAEGPWDLPGAGLFLVGTLGLVYSVKEVAAHGPRTGIAIAGALGAGTLALFFRRQLRLSAPLIDLRLFRNRAFSVVVSANLLAMLGLSGVVFFLTQFFQLVDGYNPMKAGLAELPAAVGAAAFGVLAGVAVRVWSAHAVLASGLALIGAALASLTLISTATTYPQLGIALLMVGVGLGLVYTVANNVILASAAPEQAGAAAAVSETSFELGMALGVAALGSVVAGVYRGIDVPPETSDAVAELARETLSGAHQAAATLPPGDARELLSAARSAFTDGLAVAAGVGSVLLMASAVAVWVLLNRHPPLLSEVEALGPLHPDRCLDLVGRDRLGAEEPVLALHAGFAAFDAILGDTARTGGRHDHPVTGAPVGRGGHAEVVGGLKGLDHPQQLVEVAAQAQRVIDDRADHALRVDDEHRAHGLGGVLAGHDHPVALRDLHRDVVDEREGDLDVVHVAERDLLLDGAQPGDVAVQTVDREPYQLGVVGGELILHRCEGHELAGAYRGEVGGVGEEDDPLTGVIAREVDRALGGAGGETRSGVADARHGRGGCRCVGH